MAFKRFIIVGMQRSGTTVTHVCLAGHPEVAMAVDEVYVEPFYTRGLTTFTGGKESYETRKAGYERLFDALASLDANDRTRAVGIKTAVRNHADSIAFANCLREYLPDVAVVVVYRDDLVAQYGSLLRAEKSGEWHRTEGVQTSFEGRFRLDPSRFADYADDSVRSLAQLRTLHATHRVHEIHYEADIVPGTGYERIFEFLGIQVVPPKWLRMSKVAPPPQDFIDNYDQLRAAQLKIPTPAVEEERQLARRMLREAGQQETPSFLLHRAIDRLQAGRGTDAIGDVFDALRRGERADLWLRGAAFAELEAAAADLPQRADALRGLADGFEDKPVFLLNRARVRLQRDAAPDALDDVVAALRTPVAPDSFDARHAFDLLESALARLQDVPLAEALVHEFEGPYGSGASYWILRALVARTGGDRAAARVSAERALELQPDLPRARHLAAELREPD